MRTYKKLKYPNAGKYATCPYCNYSWKPRKEHPKVCPWCKTYFKQVKQL